LPSAAAQVAKSERIGPSSALGKAIMIGLVASFRRVPPKGAWEMAWPPVAQ
jgi:hypothetical protein